jgi:hypothetical protein
MGSWIDIKTRPALDEVIWKVYGSESSGGGQRTPSLQPTGPTVLAALVHARSQNLTDCAWRSLASLGALFAAILSSHTTRCLAFSSKFSLDTLKPDSRTMD